MAAVGSTAVSAAAFWIAVPAFVAGVLLTLWWLRRRRVGPRRPQRTPIPSTMPARELGAWLAPRLSGSPSTLEPGETAPLTAGLADGSPRRVVWVDGPDEALVHLDSVRTRVVGTTLVMSIDLETDETGRAPVIVRFALGSPDDPGGLVAATDEVPHGPSVLVSRWGEAVQAALWSSLLSLAVDHAAQNDSEPRAIGIERGRLALRTAGKATA